MEEISLNILDIAMNSVAAGARNIEISVSEGERVIALEITDDGTGMSGELLKNAFNPFVTTRTERSVGLGLPLLKLAAEMTGGRAEVFSETGRNHGTKVTAEFFTDSLDCPPLGDFAETAATLVQGNPEKDFVFSYRTEKGENRVSTKEMREILKEVSINELSVLEWIKRRINEPFEDGESQV